MRPLRSWLTELLGISDEAAKLGDWWEIDFVLVLLFGALLAGIMAWVAM